MINTFLARSLAAGALLASPFAVHAASISDPAGDLLATRPRGVAPDHPRLHLLRHRSLYAHRGWEPDDVLHEAATVERVVAVWRATRPLTEWIDDHVGPSEHQR